MSRNIRLFSMYSFFTLALSACGTSDPQAVVDRVALQSFDTCEALEQYIEDTAVKDMKLELDSLLEERNRWRGNPMPAMMEDGNVSSAPPTKSSEPAAHTTTNTQVAGVDEADFVKNDGTRIFVLTDGTLHAARSWPPEELALTGSLQIEGWPREMYLQEDKDRMVVFSGVNLDWSLQGGELRSMCEWRGCYSNASATKITVVDVSDLASPKVAQEYYLPGNYSYSRRVGSAVRVVLSDYLHQPSGVQYYPDNYWDYQEDFPWLLQLEINKLKSSNEALIRARSLSDWLPGGKLKTAAGEIVDVSYNCSDFHRPNAPVRLGLASILTLNLDQPGQLDRTTIMGAAHEIYASQTSLYLSNRHWWWWDRAGQSDHTYIHKFDITDPHAAVYVASGGVQGHILDQFSMDEHQGFFRVATTIRSWVPAEEPEPWRQWDIKTTNRVSVLGEQAGQLKVVGATKEMAEGERIFSARFMGDKGYVVTFEQVDPLFTIDLSDPANPRVIGELKVPGFSTYIHPLGDDHLLTIGEHRPDPDDPNGSWEDRGIKLTLFDVSDFANPKEKYTVMVGNYSGNSEAVHEHKAFNYFAERGLLAIPFADYQYSSGDYDWERFVSEVRVYTVDVNKGINKIGGLSFNDIYTTRGDYNWTSWYSPYVRRSVMASDTQGNDFIYAISDSGIRVSNLDAVQTPIQTALFPESLQQ